MKVKHVIAAAVSAFVLYLVAYGPLFRLLVFRTAPEPVLAAIEIAYAPLWWIADRSKPIDRALESYEIWWSDAF